MIVSQASSTTKGRLHEPQSPHCTPTPHNQPEGKPGARTHETALPKPLFPHTACRSDSLYRPDCGPGEPDGHETQAIHTHTPVRHTHSILQAHTGCAIASKAHSHKMASVPIAPRPGAQDWSRATCGRTQVAVHTHTHHTTPSLCRGST
jgi:hypothetical protein